MQNAKITVSDLERTTWKAATIAELGRSFVESDRTGDALKHAAVYAESCLGWIWRQWLLGSPHEFFREQVGALVTRGLEIRASSRSMHQRSRHDLLLLCCAILASNESQLRLVAEAVSDSSVDGDVRPADDGELYAAAWCGLIKNRILGADQEAAAEFDIIWSSQRDSQVVAAPRALTTPWVRRDWKKFVEQQAKDFERLWRRARKDGWTVQSETGREIVIRTDGYQIGHMWCWAHCGMALLAHREGVEVATDPLWFPPCALRS